jgi:hypothetical protein
MEREQERNLEIPPQARRLRYLLLPKGLNEKTRLAAGFMGRSLTLYRRRPAPAFLHRRRARPRAPRARDAHGILPHRVACPMMAAMSDWSSALERLIEERTARVAVAGMGYVGPSLTVELGRAGLTVRGTA